MNFYSQDFMHFFNSMVQFDPTSRPTIDELLYHKWLQGETWEYSKVLNEIESRRQIIKDGLEAERI